MITLELFIAFSVFAFVSSITPGPNNIMLMASGTNFGFSIDSYYNRNTKMSINIVGGKGIAWIGVGTDALGHNSAGRTVSLGLKKYFDPEDLLSVVRKIVFP